MHEEGRSAHCGRGLYTTSRASAVLLTYLSQCFAMALILRSRRTLIYLHVLPSWIYRIRFLFSAGDHALPTKTLVIYDLVSWGLLRLYSYSVRPWRRRSCWTGWSLRCECCSLRCVSCCPSLCCPCPCPPCWWKALSSRRAVNISLAWKKVSKWKIHSLIDYRLLTCSDTRLKKVQWPPGLSRTLCSHSSDLSWRMPQLPIVLLHPCGLIQRWKWISIVCSVVGSVVGSIVWVLVWMMSRHDLGTVQAFW